MRPVAFTERTENYNHQHSAQNVFGGKRRSVRRTAQFDAVPYIATSPDVNGRSVIRRAGYALHSARRRYLYRSPGAEPT